MTTNTPTTLTLMSFLRDDGFRRAQDLCRGGERRKKIMNPPPAPEHTRNAEAPR